MARKNEGEFLNYVLMGHAQAIEFCNAVFKISQTWDDLVDRDEPVSDEAIDAAFWMALITIPSNPFYQRHMLDLTPLLRQYIMDWQDANVLERGTEDERNIAFVLRDAVGSMVIQCAYLIGGYDWKQKISVKVRQHVFDETLDKYKHGLEGVK